MAMKSKNRRVIKRLGTALFIFSFLSFTGCGYNSLQRQDEEVKGAWSEVENQYQRRHDLIPNLVGVVKGYAAHEKETLEAVVKARAEATQKKIYRHGRRVQYRRQKLSN